MHINSNISFSSVILYAFCALFSRYSARTCCILLDRQDKTIHDKSNRENIYWVKKKKIETSMCFRLVSVLRLVNIMRVDITAWDFKTHGNKKREEVSPLSYVLCLLLFFKFFYFLLFIRDLMCCCCCCNCCVKYAILYDLSIHIRFFLWIYQKIFDIS